MKKAMLITNIPAPYRVPVFERVGSMDGFDFCVIFATSNEANRKWGTTNLRFRHITLEGTRTIAKSDGFNYVHFNWSLWPTLTKESPDLVILGGLNPIHLLGWLWCVTHGKHFAFLTDGWSYSEKDLGMMHRLLRKALYPKASAMLGPSQKSMDHYRTFGVRPERLFQTHLCADNERFQSAAKSWESREYHLLFSGTFTERKMPLFFAGVCQVLKQAIPNLRVQIIGSGELEATLLAQLEAHNIDVTFSGYAPQSDLPGIYANAKLFLFPTLFDAWGVVANEALAAGTPVITTPYSGAADELVIHNNNGYVIEPDVQPWAQKALMLLNDERLWTAYSHQAIESAASYNYDNAARGLSAAIKHSLKLA